MLSVHAPVLVNSFSGRPLHPTQRWCHVIRGMWTHVRHENQKNQNLCGALPSLPWSVTLGVHRFMSAHAAALQRAPACMVVLHCTLYCPLSAAWRLCNTRHTHTHLYTETLQFDISHNSNPISPTPPTLAVLLSGPLAVVEHCSA